MLTQPQVQRYSADSGLRDIMIAEKEVVLTFLLQLLSERHTRRPTNRCSSPSVRAKFSDRGIIQVAFCEVPNVHEDNELPKKELYKQGR